VKLEDRIPSRCDDESSIAAGEIQRALEFGGFAAAIEKVNIIEYHSHIREAEGVIQPMPQLPAVTDLSRIKPYNGTSDWSPLPQQGGLAIAGWSRNQRDRLRAVT